MAYDPNDPADKAIVDGLIADALEEAATEHEAAVEGLKRKNTKLLGDLRALKAGTPAEGDADELIRLENELTENKTKLRDAERLLRTATRELSEAKSTAETESAFSRNLLVENGLTEALLAVNVAPQFVEAAKSLLSKGVTVQTDGDSRKAVVGDKSLGDYVKEWAASDAGKHFVAAPANGGGGSGGQGQGSGQIKKLADMSEIERLEMSRTNPIGWQNLLASEGPKPDIVAA